MRKQFAIDFHWPCGHAGSGCEHGCCDHMTRSCTAPSRSASPHPGEAGSCSSSRSAVLPCTAKPYCIMKRWLVYLPEQGHLLSRMSLRSQHRCCVTRFQTLVGTSAHLLHQHALPAHARDHGQPAQVARAPCAPTVADRDLLAGRQACQRDQLHIAAALAVGRARPSRMVGRVKERHKREALGAQAEGAAAHARKRPAQPARRIAVILLGQAGEEGAQPRLHAAGSGRRA